jgi:hypothetical protein
MKGFLLSLVVFVLFRTAKAGGGGLYVYTGYEEQLTPATKTSLYHIELGTGDVARVVNYDNNGVRAKGGVPDEYCVAGQDAHFAYSTSTHTLYGLPKDGAKVPMIMHNTYTNTSVCDDSIEDSWGLTIFNKQNGVGGRGNQMDTFVAFSSNYAGSRWSFEVGLVKASGAVNPKSTATWTRQLLWETDSTSHYNMFPCAINTGYAAVDANTGKLFILCGGGVGDIPWFVYTVSTAKKWKMIQGANMTGDASGSLSKILGFSSKEGGLRGVFMSQTGVGLQYRLGYVSPATGNWIRPPVPVKAQDGSNISDLLSTFAVDAISETVYAFSAANAAAEVLTIDMASGVVTSRVKLRKQLKITNMVFVGDDVI